MFYKHLKMIGRSGITGKSKDRIKKKKKIGIKYLTNFRDKK